MEASGFSFRRIPCLSGAKTDTRSSKPSISCVSVGSRKLRVLGFQQSRARVRPRKAYGAMIMNSGFCDNGHMRYYYVSPMCSGKKEKEKSVNSCSSLTAKKKLKLFKGLAEDLAKFSDMGFGLDAHDGLAADVQQKAIADAVEVLMSQLQHLRAAEELKKRRKQENAKLKDRQMNIMLDCESSSSSSESSDSECEDVIDMSFLRSEPLTQATLPVLDEVQLVSQENATTLTLPSRLTQEGSAVVSDGLGDLKSENEVERCTGIGTSSSSNSFGHNDRCSSVNGSPTKRIEVCMGGKCKKSGAAILLEEFGKVIGVEGAAVGCKCLGKCRDGPNVRILNSVDGSEAEGADVSVRTPLNPLCIGVGLDDVGVIVSNFFGDELISDVCI
ncbi:diacylglycerol O-acyltransferase 3 [Juglans microcarpa x Juglans regia]|uniref:diacylglycerol O-acyltransferase 3 n=1 Tax=Juglans microcarpa x Juglans regia TaxID=2249226 RepID=UPI001B7DB1A5|nr:diacylglycerol O-acyltransferase 3 [Juglans microcarpa x Juglans regia]